jgi:hypothetical protein
MVWQVLDDAAEGRSWDFICNARWEGRFRWPLWRRGPGSSGMHARLARRCEGMSNWLRLEPAGRELSRGPGAASPSVADPIPTNWPGGGPSGSQRPGHHSPPARCSWCSFVVLGQPLLAAAFGQGEVGHARGFDGFRSRRGMTGRSSISRCRRTASRPPRPQRRRSRRLEGEFRS